MKKANEVIRIDGTLCIGCGLCADDCIRESILLVEGKAVVGDGECNNCGHCGAICPVGAVAYADGEDVPQPAGRMPAEEDVEWMMKHRRSVRHFLPEPVPQEDIEKILDLGRYAPTARNAQNVSFRILTESIGPLETFLDEKLLQLQQASGEAPQGERIRDGYIFRGAPCAVLVCSKTPANALISAAYMELYAASMGYGGVYVGRLITALRQIPELREKIGLSAEDEPVTCFAFGRPAVRYQRVPRREPADIRYL